MRATLLILSAPSGTGKTTLARRVVAAHPGAIFSVSYTTRAPRDGEKDGVDYHFVDDATFASMEALDEFAESAHVQGGIAFKEKYPEAVRALILPPSMSELERRLRARSTDSDAAINRRLQVAREEILRARSAGYEYWIVNDSLERAYHDIEAIVRAENCRAEGFELSRLLAE